MDRHEEGRTGEAIFSVEGKGKIFVGVEQHAPSLHKAFVPLLVRVNRFVDFRFIVRAVRTKPPHRTTEDIL